MKRQHALKKSPSFIWTEYIPYEVNEKQENSFYVSQISIRKITVGHSFTFHIKCDGIQIFLHSIQWRKTINENIDDYTENEYQKIYESLILDNYRICLNCKRKKVWSQDKLLIGSCFVA